MVPLGGPAQRVAVSVSHAVAFVESLKEARWTPGSGTLLELAEARGLEPEFSCREGQCSACACVMLEGDVRLQHNEVLDADDLADGIRLVCQARPLSERIRISYNG